MLLSEILMEGRFAPLYHGFKEVKYAIEALENDRMAVTSTQRFWGDGKRRKHDNPEYDGSYWMKGISATRDIRYAKAWGYVVFELDQEKLAQRYKIIPFNWGYSIPDWEIPTPQHHKREREEFIAVKKNKDTYERDDEVGGGFDTNRFVSPEGYISPLSRYLTGIMVSENYWEPKELEIFIKHPLFKGTYRK